MQPVLCAMIGCWRSQSLEMQHAPHGLKTRATFELPDSSAATTIPAMPSPVILSTWSFGVRANAAAWPILASGGSSLDAVEAACRDAEDDLNNHTVGVGGYPDRDGDVSLDASIMLSPSRCGAVAAIRQFAHPVTIARRVMENTRHILLAGSGAEVFALEQGFEPTTLVTPEARGAWEKWRASSGVLSAKPQAAGPTRNVEELGLKRSDTGRDTDQTHDTIGALAIDSSGTLAGACSTSGLRFKLPGRVGDSPIVGHALYVDPDVGAAVGTGHGELLMGVCGGFLAAEAMRRGASPLDAAIEVLTRVSRAFELTTEDQVGIIVLHRSGQWSGASLRPGFRVAVRTGERDELVEPERVLLT
jgi:isoaspartyl peptidase/L-asparaginase-like protein (Ntn-hydrolase superfamily)